MPDADKRRAGQLNVRASLDKDNQSCLDQSFGAVSTAVISVEGFVVFPFFLGGSRPVDTVVYIKINKINQVKK